VIADGRSAVVGLLARCPNLRILTTSRVVLDVRGEGVRQLGPLPIEEAVTLFADRGLDAVHGFTVGHDNTGAIRSICEQVDRLPLGIELAAARLRAFTPTQLDAQLALRLSTTAGIGEGREPRHRTLPATVAWSYDLLFSPERALLRRLSVFRGSFALDAVEAVTIDDEMSPAEVGDALARLVDKSLVVAEHGDREPRFRLLRTVADFAAAALDPGETEALGRRHAEWIAQLAAEASPALRGPDQARWAARLHDEVPNIDAALAHARAGGDVATGVRTCVDLAWFALTTTALPTALDDVLALLAADAALPNALEARARAWVAVLGAGRPVAAVMGASAIDLARSLGDGHVLAEALIVTAMPLSRHVTTAGVAIASAQEGRALAGKTNDAWLVAAADAVEGGARGLTAEGLADAVARLERAGDGYSALGDRRSAEINAWYLSRALEDGGDLERAEAVLLPFVHGDGVPESAGAILATTQLSWLAQRHGDTAGAARHAGRLSGVAALQQRRLFWGTAQFAIGHAALVAGTLDASRAALTAALDMHLQIGMDGFVILEHALLGHVDALDGRDDESDAHHTESLRRAHAHALPLPLVLALELAAQSALVRRRAHDAGAWQARAAQLRGAHGLVATPHEQARGERALRAATAG
jgi:predicted ATPase